MAKMETQYFKPGNDGVFWYDYYYFCANSGYLGRNKNSKYGHWIPKEQAKRNGRGTPICPFCGGPLRTRPRHSHRRGKWLEAHVTRIDVK